jgi:NAD(P)H-nitrite reductase large subunit
VLICHCRRVNDGVARAAIEAGATDLDGLAELCRAGSGCGGCHPVLEELLRGTASRFDDGAPALAHRVMTPA